MSDALSTGPKTSHAMNNGPRRSYLYHLSEFIQHRWRSIVIIIPYLWLLIFFLMPFVIVLKISIAESIIARPPVSPLFDFAEEGLVNIRIIWDNFYLILSDEFYALTYVNSLRIAAIATLITLIIGYPLAYAIARATPTARNILLLMVILPFWTSFVLRIYAWMGLLRDTGVINSTLIGMGIIDEPIIMMGTETVVILGIVYSYLPFMVLPLYANMEKLDSSLREAAADLGAKPIATFLTVTLPMTIPGIIAGSLLTFIPATGEYVIPDILGQGNVNMIGRVLYDEFTSNRDWPVASAVAIALLIILVAPIMYYQHIQSKQVET